MIEKGHPCHFASFKNTEALLKKVVMQNFFKISKQMVINKNMYTYKRYIRYEKNPYIRVAVMSLMTRDLL